MQAIRYSSPRDAKDLLSLVQALPSWTGQLQPNPFRTPSITSLLDRSVILAQKDAINESQALYTLAQGAAEAGNGDPRAFIRFWAKMGWADWSSAEAYEYGQAATLLRWLKASMTVWENLRRASRDDDPLFEERTLGGEVSALALDLLYTAASTFERDGAAKQEKMWAFLDTMLAVFTRLAETVCSACLTTDTALMHHPSAWRSNLSAMPSARTQSRRWFASPTKPGMLAAPA